MMNRMQNLCRGRTLFFRDTDYCNMEKLVETENKLKRKFLSRQGVVCRNTKRRGNSGPDKETKS